MAVINGFLVGAPEAQSDNPNVPPEQFNVGGPTIDQGVDAGVGVAGDIVNEQPIARPARAVDGFVLPDFEADWYHRIWMIPRRIALGNVPSPIDTEFVLWNAHRVARDLDSIDEAGTDGLVLTDEDPPATTYRPDELRTYPLRVELDGPATIAATFTFVFEGGAEVRVLEVTGSRVVIFAFAPNWRDGLVERWAWLTDVMVAWDGTEQRRNVRRVARRSFSWRISAEALEAARVDAYVWGGHHRTYAIPVWSDVTVLDQELPAAAEQVAVVTEHMGYYAGGLALLIGPDGSSEAVEVEEVEPGVVHFARPTRAAWPRLTRVAPAHVAWLDDAVQADWPSAGLAEWQVTFLVTPNSAAAVPAPEGLLEYDGRDVYVVEPNRLEAATRIYERRSNRLDADAGPFRFDARAEKASPSRGWLLSFHTRAEIEAFRSWAYHRRGAWRSFWAPAWERSLEYSGAATIGDTQTVIRVRAVGYRRFLGQPGRRDIAIRLYDGTWFFRRVVDVEEDGDDELLELDSALGQTVPAASIELFTWLEPVRLDGDVLELTWHSRAIADSRFQLRVLPS